MLVLQCDECKRIGEPGDHMTQVMVTESSGAPFSTKTYCSQRCASDKIVTYMSAVLHGLTYRVQFETRKQF